MKLAFHILRMNWYRVLSAAIDEAMRRGHEVECWHNAGAFALGANVARREKVPSFRHGTPTIVDYAPPSDLIHLVRSRGVDAIVDTNPPPEMFRAGWPERPERPYWVLLEGVPAEGVAQIRCEAQIYQCDLFCFRSRYYADVGSSVMGRDNSATLELLTRNRYLWGSWEDILRECFRFRWSARDCEYVRTHSVVTGYPAFDTLDPIEPEAVRAEWGIPAGRRVVGLLPAPFRHHGGSLWETLFMCERPVRRALRAVASGRPAMVRALWENPTHAQVLGGLSAFCEREGCCLVAKTRHSQDTLPSLRRAADLIVGEDRYHPHTAMQLYKVSDVVFGFYSSGAFEAVAARRPYVNVEIPFFLRDVYEALWPSFREQYGITGVSERVSAAEVAAGLPGRRLDDFRIDPVAAMEYQDRHCGPLDGRNSERFMAAVERLVSTGCGQGEGECGAAAPSAEGKRSA